MTGEDKEFIRVKECRTEKFGLSLTPKAQQDTIADPSGGATIDTEARAAINLIIDRLQAFGLIA